MEKTGDITDIEVEEAIIRLMSTMNEGDNEIRAELLKQGGRVIVLERTKLLKIRWQEQNRKLQERRNGAIGKLSKGYRQRVGLANALLHDPDVLILDEPTTGLDPNQLVDIRNLIKKLGEEKTVFLSTHIMQEVEEMCSRVIIINKGEIVLDSPTSALSELAGIKLIHVEFDGEASAKALMQISGVRKVEQNGKAFTITAKAGSDVRPQLFEFAVANNLKVLEVSQQEQNLEDIFREMTKRQ